MNLGTLKLVTLFALLLSVVPIYAHKIVLLTSLDPETNRPPLRLRSWNINEKLEKRFYKEHQKFKTPISTKVVHFARAEDLYKNLKDPEVVGLIWVGHAGFADGEGLGSLRSIVDYKGHDLKSLFQAVGPQLKYLGLVGCRGKLFLNEWKEKGYFNHVPHLITYGREVRTDARKGLKLAMRALAERIENNPKLFSSDENVSLPILGEAYQNNGDVKQVITITRKNNEAKKMASVQILQKDRLIGFFSRSDEDQVNQILLNKGERKSDLKIISDSGAASSEIDINLGELEIQGDENDIWKIFATSSGKPIGVGKHIYRYKNLN